MTAHAALQTNDSILIRGLSGLMYDCEHNDAPEPHHVDFEVSVVNGEKRYRVCIIAPDPTSHATFIYDGQGKMMDDSGELWKGCIEEAVVQAIRVILDASKVREHSE